MISRSKRLRARYIGYTRNTENHGDEALIWIIRDLLSPEIEVLIDCEDYDLALLGGGTLINQSPWLIDVFKSALDKAGRGFVFGSGVGDLTFWGNHFDKWSPLLARCEHIGVRGPDSVALLKKFGGVDAICIGDPYLILQRPMKRDPTPKTLGVNLGSTNDSLWGDDDRNLHDFLIDVLREMKSDGWSFVWISVWSKDLPLIERAREKVGRDSGPLIDARFQSLEAFSLISGCEIFLGEKLHANAMAAVASVPFIALEYQPKISDFAASLDMSPWIVSTAERNPEILIDRINNLREQREMVRNRLVAARNDLRKRLLKFADAVKSHYANTG